MQYLLPSAVFLLMVSGGVAPGAPLLTRNLARKAFDMHLAASYQVWAALMGRPERRRAAEVAACCLAPSNSYSKKDLSTCRRRYLRGSGVTAVAGS